jgi:hypothetical protein
MKEPYAIFVDGTVNQMTADELILGGKWSSGDPVEKNQIDFEFISPVTGEWIHMTISEYVNHNAYCYSRSDFFFFFLMMRISLVLTL